MKVNAGIYLLGQAVGIDLTIFLCFVAHRDQDRLFNYVIFVYVLSISTYE